MNRTSFTRLITITVMQSVLILINFCLKLDFPGEDPSGKRFFEFTINWNALASVLWLVKNFWNDHGKFMNILKAGEEKKKKIWKRNWPAVTWLKNVTIFGRQASFSFARNFSYRSSLSWLTCSLQNGGRNGPESVKRIESDENAFRKKNYKRYGIGFRFRRKKEKKEGKRRKRWDKFLESGERILLGSNA